MKTIRLLHTYIACAFAPLTIFFFLSGAVQTWNLHKGRKDNSYTPPAIVAKLCDVHTEQHWRSEDRTTRPIRWPFRVAMTILSLGMLSTIALGIVMAYRFSTNKRRISLLLLTGVVVPILMVLVQSYFPSAESPDRNRTNKKSPRQAEGLPRATMLKSASEAESSQPMPISRCT